MTINKWGSVNSWGFGGSDPTVQATPTGIVWNGLQGVEDSNVSISWNGFQSVNPSDINIIWSQSSDIQVEGPEVAILWSQVVSVESSEVEILWDTQVVEPVEGPEIAISWTGLSLVENAESITWEQGDVVLIDPPRSRIAYVPDESQLSERTLVLRSY